MMRPENIGRMRRSYGPLCHDSMNDLPDGWASIIGEFYHAMESIGDLVDAVSVRFEHTESGLRAFVFPEMSRWSNEQMNALRLAQRSLYESSQRTCETCGKEGGPADFGRALMFLCSKHKSSETDRRAREQALYNECAILFPWGHGSAINLFVPAHLEELLAKCLRQIKDVVVAEGGYLIGKITITRIAMIEGQLFVRQTYNEMPAGAVAAMVEVDDIVRFLEAQSDELTRMHGGSDAS